MSNRNRQPVRAGTVPVIAAAAAPVAQTPSPAAPEDQTLTEAAAATPSASVSDPATGNAAPIEGQAQAATETEEVDEEVEGRVLVAFNDYQPNDVYVGWAEDALALEVELKIDCDPKAVAYAKSLVQG